MTQRGRLLYFCNTFMLIIGKFRSKLLQINCNLYLSYLKYGHIKLLNVLCRDERLVPNPDLVLVIYIYGMILGTLES